MNRYIIIGDNKPKERITRQVLLSLANKPENILVCAPHKILLKSVFELIHKRLNLIAPVTGISNFIKRYTSAPWYEIQLITGTRVRGFVLDNRCLSISGQAADAIYVLNTEACSAEDIYENVTPILQSTPYSDLTLFFNEEMSDRWKLLIKDGGFEIEYAEQEVAEDPDKGMITNPFTGRKSWL